ncbi:MAG: LL-diaminopimelate aminotransferase [Actinobacteria bacterium]|nr:MAG: LL-diaminopimelate aminotransferase [Actinomycetota bacterium]
MRPANRIDNLPPYLFAEIDKKVAAKKAEGVDVISLGIGDPDQPTPRHIVEKLLEAARDPANHRYPSYFGLPAFRAAAAEWVSRRFGVSLDPDREVLPMIGSKEGIAHIFLAFVDPGETSLVADPGYPVYNTGTILSSGRPYFMPLLEENDFLPDLDAIPADVAAVAKIMMIGYPNNPTSAIATEDFFARVVDFARSHDVVVVHDNAYSEIAYDGYRPPSFLETPGAKDVGVEFHSLSKSFNMTGWRIAFAVGNEDVIEALGRVKTNIDSGIFNAVQYAGIEALSGPQDSIDKMCEIYQRRRDMVMPVLEDIGLRARTPKATIYVWARVPEGYTSASFAAHVLDKAGVIVAPGTGYGPSGEGYVRLSLTIGDDRLAEALERIRETL